MSQSEQTTHDRNCQELIKQDEILQLQPDYIWMKKLLSLQKSALIIQYQLAYYSTLGGAYSVCNHPKQALYIAKNQELLGKLMNSNNVIIRAKLYQSINLSRLKSKKRSKLALDEATSLAQKSNSVEMIEFCQTISKWTRNNLNSELPQIHIDTLLPPVSL
jgi:hypothetical protein